MDDENSSPLAPPCGWEYEAVDRKHKAACKKYQGICICEVRFTSLFLAPQSRGRLEECFPTLPLDRSKPFGVSETREYVYAAPRQARGGGQPKRPSRGPCQSFATEAAGMHDRLPGIDNTVKSQEYRLGRVLEYADLQVGERSKVRFLPWFSQFRSSDPDCPSSNRSILPT